MIAKGSSDDDKSLRGVLGVQITLMNEADPALRKDGHLRLDSKVLRQLGLAKDQAEAIADSKHTDTSLHYNSTWSAGAAGSMISQDGSGSDLRSNGYALYTTYAYGFEGMEKFMSKDHAACSRPHRPGRSGS